MLSGGKASTQQPSRDLPGNTAGAEQPHHTSLQPLDSVTVRVFAIRSSAAQIDLQHQYNGSLKFSFFRAISFILNAAGGGH